MDLTKILKILNIVRMVSCVVDRILGGKKETNEKKDQKNEA